MTVAFPIPGATIQERLACTNKSCRGFIMNSYRWLAILIALGCTIAVVAGDGPNVLTDKEKSAGFELLFNSTDLKGWEHNKNWAVEDGAIARRKGGGDLTYKVKKI